MELAWESWRLWRGHVGSGPLGLHESALAQSRCLGAKRLPSQEVHHACHQQRRRSLLFSKRVASGGRGYPSETHVRRGDRVVHGDKELLEKLGRNDLCPCGSGRRFQELLHEVRRIRRQRAQPLPTLTSTSNCLAVAPADPIRHPSRVLSNREGQSRDRHAGIGRVGAGPSYGEPPSVSPPIQARDGHGCRKTQR